MQAALGQTARFRQLSFSHACGGMQRPLQSGPRRCGCAAVREGNDALPTLAFAILPG